jgi:hypothetical protein
MENTKTIATPPTDLLKILILQRRDAALESLEGFYKMEIAGAGAPSHIAQARIRTLFLDLEPSIRRNFKREEFNIIQKQVFNGNIKEVIEAFRKMNDYLDKINITLVDTKIRIDSTNAEEENSAKGL